MRIWIISSASGNGKTTLGRELAARLEVPFVELDQLVHGPDWSEISDELLRERLTPIAAGQGWVIDGNYQRKLGAFLLDAADLVVWLDLPIRVWMPRLVRRSWRRMISREPLWNGNRETLRGLLWGREALFAWALTSHFNRRRDLPGSLLGRNVIRLRTTSEVERFLTSVASGGGCRETTKTLASGT